MVNNNPTNKKKVLMVQGLHEEGKNYCWKEMILSQLL